MPQTVEESVKTRLCRYALGENFFWTPKTVISFTYEQDAPARHLRKITILCTTSQHRPIPLGVPSPAMACTETSEEGEKHILAHIRENPEPLYLGNRGSD